MAEAFDFGLGPPDQGEPDPPDKAEFSSDEVEEALSKIVQGMTEQGQTLDVQASTDQELSEGPPPEIDWSQDTFLQKIQPVSKLSRHLKILLYGDNGCGKTWLAAHAPAPLLIDTEKGRRTLLNSPALRNVPVLALDSFNDIDVLFWKLKAGALPEIETIIIDSFSELQRKAMDLQLERAHERDPNRSLFLPFQQDYKMNSELLRRVLINFQELDRNLIVTAQVIEDNDELLGTKVLRPAVTPAVARTLKSIFDVVAYMGTDWDPTSQTKKNRFLQLAPSYRITAKCRIGGLPDVLQNPTFDTLFNAHIKQLEEAAA